MGSFQTFGLIQLVENRPAANVSNADGVDGSCTIGVKCAIMQLLETA